MSKLSRLREELAREKTEDLLNEINKEENPEIIEKEMWDHYSELPNPSWYEYKESQEFQNQIKYKEVLNKEIAEAREYTNVDEHTAVDTHQLMKMDKQHIIEVLVHAIGTIRHLKDDK
jgi:hypothetical protein